MALRSPILAAAAIAACLAACRTYPYAQKTPDELFADAGVDIGDGNGAAALNKLEYLKTKFANYNKEGVEFRTADAERVSGKLWRAFTDFKQFEEHYRVTSYYYKNLQDSVYAIGTQLIQSRYSFLGLGIFRDADDGVLVLQFFVEKFSASSRADEALRQIAEYKYEIGDYQGAIEAYEKILNGYKFSVWRDQAEYRIAIARLRGVRRADLDQNDLFKARQELQVYLATRAEGARREEARIALRECEEKLAESEYLIGEFYRIIGQHFGALLHYELAITNYPAAKYTVEAERRVDELARASKSETPPKPAESAPTAP